MLKQSPGRNQRSKRFKVKHVLQICLLLAIGFWLLKQLKHSYDERQVYDFENRNGKILEKVQGEHEISKLGRKDLLPRVEEETALGIESQVDKVELEEEMEEVKPEETEDDGRGGGDDEIDGNDQERAEDEETEGVEDLIDVDDREREDGSEENGNQLEDANSLDDHAQNGGERNFQEAREEHYKHEDASSSVGHGTQTISAEFGIGGRIKVKEKEVENAEAMELEQQSKSRGIKEVFAEIIYSGPKVGNEATLEYSGDGLDLGSDSSPSTEEVPYEKPEFKFNSRLMLIETHDFLKGTGTLQESIQLGTVSKSTAPEHTLKPDSANAVSEGNSAVATINENNDKVSNKDSESILSEAVENAE